MAEKPEKKETYGTESTSTSTPDAVNQRVVEVLLSVLNEVQQRASRLDTVELPPEVQRDIDFTVSAIGVIDGGLALTTPFTVNSPLSPATGPPGREITISGASLVPFPPPAKPASVIFEKLLSNGQTESQPASAVTMPSTSEIKMTAPTFTATTPREADVVVITGGGTQRLPNAFRYD